MPALRQANTNIAKLIPMMGITFRLPYNSIVRFVPYADGVGICRDGGREQIFSPQHIANSVNRPANLGDGAYRALTNRRQISSLVRP
jgi:hypothetical protein